MYTYINGHSFIHALQLNLDLKVCLSVCLPVEGTSGLGGKEKRGMRNGFEINFFFMDEVHEIGTY